MSANPQNKQQQRRRRDDDNNNHSQRRKMPSLLAGNAASAKTGPVKALQAFRKRQEKKKLHTAKELRKYKKVMQQHGYQPGTGAKRRRVDESQTEQAAAIHDGKMEEKDITALDERDDSNQEASSTAAQSSSTTSSKPQAVKEKSTISAEDRLAKQKKRQQQERHRKLAARKQRTERLKQRTSRGQPVMKNLVHDILDKLQKKSSSA
jgi:hypothetical protein